MARKDSTGGATPTMGKAVQAMAEVGGVRSSDDPVPGLWFGELTSKRVRRGSFNSVGDLKKAIGEFLDAWNENPRPFLWTASVESIQQKLARCRQTLEQISPGCTQPRKRKPKKPMSS